jgi:predicted MFS family arabinose efflux permease
MGNINYLFDIAPPQERPLYLGFTNTLFGIGIFTSALGGLIVDWSGFTLLLGVSAVCYGLALALSFLMIEPRRKRELSA